MIDYIAVALVLLIVFVILTDDDSGGVNGKLSLWLV